MRYSRALRASLRATLPASALSFFDHKDECLCSGGPSSGFDSSSMGREGIEPSTLGLRVAQMQVLLALPSHAE